MITRKSIVLSRYLVAHIVGVLTANIMYVIVEWDFSGSHVILVSLKCHLDDFLFSSKEK